MQLKNYGIMLKKSLSIFLAIAMFIQSPQSILGAAIEQWEINQYQKQYQLEIENDFADISENEIESGKSEEDIEPIDEIKENETDTEQIEEEENMPDESDGDAEDVDGTEEDANLTELSEEEIRAYERLDQLLESDVMFSALDEEDVALILIYCGVSAESLIICEEAGYILADSLDKAFIMDCLDISLETALMMFENHEVQNQDDVHPFGGSGRALSQARAFNYFTQQGKMTAGEQASVKQLIIDGYSISNVMMALSAANILAVTVADIILDLEDIGVKVELSTVTDDTVINFLEEGGNRIDLQIKADLVNIYHIKESFIDQYIEDNGLTLQELQDMLYNSYEIFELLGYDPSDIDIPDENTVVVESNDSMDTMATPAATDLSQFIDKTPTNINFYELNNRESVNLQNLNLTYFDPIMTLKGRNGLDLDLTLRYESYEATRESKVGYTTSMRYVSMCLGEAWMENTRNGRFQAVPADDSRYFVTNKNGLGSIPVWEDYLEDRIGGHVTKLVIGAILYSNPDHAIDEQNYIYLTRNRNKYGSNQDQVILYMNFEAIPVPSGIKNGETGVLAETADKAPVKNVAVGWSFNFSKIETDEIGDMYLHLDDGRTFKIVQSGSTYKLQRNDEDYKMTDITISKSGSQFTVTDKHGKKQIFDAEGNIARIEDRFGNQINFSKIKTVNGLTDYRITDSLNREVKLEYVVSGSIATFTVTLPENIKYEYSLSKLTQPKPDGKAYSKTRYKIDSKKDPEGRITRFSYRETNALFSFWEDQIPHTTIQRQRYWLLEKVQYPTGLETHYEYVSRDAPLGFGTCNRLYLRNRWDAYDGYSTKHNRKTYTYTDWEGKDTVSLTEVNDMTAGMSYKYEFNKDGMLHNQLISGTGAHTEETKYTYNSNKLLEKTERSYRQGSQTIWATEIYNYDAKGNMTIYYGTLSEGSRNSYFSTTYQYNQSYSLPTKETFYTGNTSATMVETTYTLTNGNKSISGQTTKEGGVIKSNATFGYDSYGNLTQRTDYYETNKGITTKYEYDRGAYLKKASINGVGTSYTYSTIGNVLMETLPKNNYKITYTYDKLGRLTSTSEPGGISTRLKYADKSTGSTITFTNENGHDVLYNYNSFGRIQSIKDISSNTTIYSCSYDLALRLSSETDGNNVRTTYQYDGLSRVLEKRTGSAYTEKYTYTISNQISGGPYFKTQKTISGVSGAPDIVTASYTDKHGRLAADSFTLNGKEYYASYKYDNIGNVIEDLTVKDAEAKKQYSNQYKYDYRGNLLEHKNILGDTYTNKYDLMGRLTEAKDPKGYIYEYYYDDFSRITESRLPFYSNTVKAVQTYKYDNNGNVTEQTTTNHLQSSGSKTTTSIKYDYDGRNQLTRATNVDGGKEVYVDYTYDKVGNTLTMATANGTQTTTYRYKNNALNQLDSVIDPLGKIESYTYDKSGNVEKIVDKNGNIIVNTYDALNRLTKAVVSNTNTYNEFVYAPSGALLTEKNENFTTQNTYDALGRLKTQTDSNGAKKEYEYDLAHNVTGMKLYNNATLVTNASYEYDALNRLSNVKDNNTSLATYQYDKNGNRASLTYNESGIVTTYAYNQANLVTNVTNKKGATVLSSYEYTYYLDGNQATKKDHLGRITSYTYDGLGRLTAEEEQTSEAIQRLEYTYDTAGNRQTMKADGPKAYHTTYTYDANNRLLRELTVDSQTSAQTVASYAYDANGNQIMKAYSGISPKDIAAAPGIRLQIVSETQENPTGPVEKAKTGVETYTYDGFNRLIRFEKPGARATYEYKADGLRISKTVNGETVNHIWNGSNIVAEMDAAGAVMDRYVRGLNLIKSDGNGYYLFNAHGDVVQLADGSGNVTRDYAYDAFGVEDNQDNLDTNVFRYCGEYYDAESETIYLRARYYHPGTGRFITEDPIQDGLNWYTYVANNPIKFIDIFGLSLESIMAKAKDVAEHGYTKYSSLEMESITGDYLFIHDETLLEHFSQDLLVDFIDFMETSRGYTPNSLGGTTFTLKEKSQLAFAYNASRSGMSYDDFMAMIAFDAFFTLGNAIQAVPGVLNEYNVSLCFIEGTVIITFEGFKTIEGIKIGDEVYSENEITGEKGYKMVVNVFVNEVMTLVNVEIMGEVIGSTEEHPYWVDGKGWTPAKDLSVGDRLKLADGSFEIISNLTIELLEAPVKVYNFEVEDWHTYFVSSIGILVHNTCWQNLKSSELSWTNHGNKHVASQSKSWNSTVKSTQNGPAKYKVGTNVMELEMTAWDNGVPVTSGRTWKVMEFNYIIGASSGKETRFMRVELSGGTLHGHPISQAEYLKLIK